MISLDVGEASVSAMQITPDGKIALTRKGLLPNVKKIDK